MRATGGSTNSRPYFCLRSSSLSSSNHFRIALCVLLATIAIGAAYAQSAEVRMLVQSSPLAGFQYYQGKVLWDEMKVGDALALVREADNPHDSNAVRVEWRGH